VRHTLGGVWFPAAVCGGAVVGLSTLRVLERVIVR
jgi:hypothetical protein